jgi:hypothetical protein
MMVALGLHMWMSGDPEKSSFDGVNRGGIPAFLLF